jgi:hypothetical protein
MYIQIDSHVELSKVEKQRETIEDEAGGRRRKGKEKGPDAL